MRYPQRVVMRATKHSTAGSEETPHSFSPWWGYRSRLVSAAESVMQETSASADQREGVAQRICAEMVKALWDRLTGKDRRWFTPWDCQPLSLPLGTRRLAQQAAAALEHLSEIDVTRALPDAIFADLEADPPLIVFIECVVTDGPISERRKGELEALALESGFRSSDCAYVTVFHDRNRSPYRKLATSLAWGTFVWFETEPDQIIYLKEKTEAGKATLAQLLRSN